MTKEIRLSVRMKEGSALIYVLVDNKWMDIFKILISILIGC
jgi:hypothetical protein